jgi:hypothetical protein
MKQMKQMKDGTDDTEQMESDQLHTHMKTSPVVSMIVANKSKSPCKK